MLTTKNQTPVDTDTQTENLTLFDIVGAFCAFLIIVALCGINIAAIYMGVTHDCSYDFLNNWLIVFGSVSLFILICMMSSAYYSSNNDNFVETCCTYILAVPFVFWFVWLIIGSIKFIPYNTGPNYSLCDENLYKFTIGYIITYWSLVGASFLALLCGLVIGFFPIVYYFFAMVFRE